jgi:predicted TIM-barrel fold metal-dependent hydrolase
MIADPPTIVDGHCHLASTQFVPRSFVEGIVENSIGALAAQGISASKNRLLDVLLRQLDDPTGERLVAEMAAARIDRAVLLLPDFSYSLKDCELSIAEMFERHFQVLSRWPEKFFVLAGVDPRWGREGVELFERGVSEFGFHGLKLYPPCGYSPSDRELYPFYEICAARQLPVLTHVGPTSPALAFDTSSPMLLDRAARDFPSVNFILAHGSVAYREECRMLTEYRPNVYLDISAFQAMSTDHLAKTIRDGAKHKLIFGTDWPLFRMQATNQEVVSLLLRQDGPLESMTAAQRDAFFGGTILRLLRSNDLNAVNSAAT